MLRTLKNLFKQDREKFVVPKSVQNVIPIKTIWEDGIFLVGRNKYAKTFKFEDINYAVASREDKEAMFLEYSELLNSLDSGATTKITINNRRLNKADFEQTILIPMADDGLDKYRKEYNKMLLDKATGANSIVQDKYVTVSVCKKNIEEARNYFARVGADLIAHFNRLGSKCVELDAGDKLRIFHDFYRTGEETAFHFDITQTMRKGHDFKDFICPDTVEFESDYFRMGDRYGRVIFLREYNKVIDVAHKYGYSSPTSFNRAFQSVHGIAPIAAKSMGCTLCAYPSIQFSRIVLGGSAMAYHIEEKKNIRIIGIRIPLVEDAEENMRNVPAFWKKAVLDGSISKLAELSNKNPDGILGVSVYNNPEDIYYYIAVSSNIPVPEGMVEYMIPEGMWVVFENDGVFKEDVQSVFRRFLTEFLPFSGYEYAGLPDVEIYPVCKGQPSKGHSEVWIAIKKAKEI